ncbi:MAG: AAC(3) family N-acetyltransferase [Gammaproteobacteria bacterium]
MGVVEKLSGVLHRHLDAERMDRLRSLYFAGRRRLFPLMRMVHGTFGADDLVEHLRARFPEDFDVLMVHSSVNHMEPTYTGTPLDLVNALKTFCGPERTLVMPAFYFGDPEYPSVAATFAAKPRFDLRRTPSQMGLATELFRRTRGAFQSRHPVYRVSAFGPMAEELVRGHETAGTPSGTGTPFDFMAKHRTLILGVGKFSDVLTQVHHIEDVMGDEFPVPATSGEPIDLTVVDKGEDIPVRIGQRGFQWRRDMGRLYELMPKGALHEWRFHHVPMFSTHAHAVSESLEAAARDGRTLYIPR